MYEIADYTIEPSPRRVRAYFNGALVADSRDMVLFFERPYPNYYFPQRDVRMEWLARRDAIASGDPRGDKVTWDLEVEGRRAPGAAFTYLKPPRPGQADLGRYITFVWGAMDHWFEEDDEIFVHARNPYHRVDAVHSSRHIQVSLDGVALADTKRPVLVWETGLPTRYYIPRQDVRLDLLEKTETVTRCPYKGVAETFAVALGDTLRPDCAWSYPIPIPECPKIEGLICFYNEVVDIVEDGVALARPRTHFKKTR